MKIVSDILVGQVGLEFQECVLILLSLLYYIVCKSLDVTKLSLFEFLDNRVAL
jgi:hypothetical protein